MDGGDFALKMLLNLKIIPVTRNDIPIGLPFVTMFNPEKFSIVETVYYEPEGGKGTEGAANKFIRVEPKTFILDFTLDATGVQAPKIPLLVQIALFREATTGINGLIHQPNYLIVQWGTFLSKCQLTSSTITYTLFDKTGIPLRATVQAHFKEFTDSTFQQISALLSSPDLTHQHLVTNGERIDGICHETYKDNRYYIQVARFNRIKNFRKLQGTLFLPPLSKS